MVMQWLHSCSCKHAAEKMDEVDCLANQLVLVSSCAALRTKKHKKYAGGDRLTLISAATQPESLLERMYLDFEILMDLLLFVPRPRHLFFFFVHKLSAAVASTSSHVLAITFPEMLMLSSKF